MHFSFRRAVRSALCATALVAASSSWAGIIASSGQYEQTVAPPSARLDQLTSNFNIIGFAERQNVQLSSPLAVSATATGFYSSAPVPTTLTGGPLVSSYFFHADTAINDDNGTRFEASITFDTDILALIFSSELLDATDSLFGLPSTTYAALDPLSGNRALEFNGPTVCGAGSNDCLTLSADRRTLTLVWGTSTQIDDLRVLTAAPTQVPEPGTLLLAACALAAAGVARSRHV